MLSCRSPSISLPKPFQFSYCHSQSLSIFLQSKSNIRFSSRGANSTSIIIRASSVHDFSPLSVRPGGILETDRLPSDVRKRTIDAVDAFGGRVTVGDVASTAGINLNQAQKALQALAADSYGFLEVSDEGDVLYVFPKDYHFKLAAKSWRIKFEPILEEAKSRAKAIVRYSFGTALFASIIIVFTAIVVILLAGSDKKNRKGRGGISYNSGFNFYHRPTKLFWFWEPQKDDMENFIPSIFSFVFGHGDPNAGIEKERWKLIGQYIASVGGVTTAEELAPYLDVENTKEVSDDSYILPVLLQFDGQPEIDEEGNILYRFPSLQRTASSQKNGKEYVVSRWADRIGGVDRSFRENQWQFSKTSISQKAMIMGLGGLNLFGVGILGSLLEELAVEPSRFITFVSKIFPLLQIYAVSFFAIPLVRWFFVQWTNAKIEKRNRAREQHSLALEKPDLSLRRKLSNARDMANKTFISQDKIVYSTDKDFVEQDYEYKKWA